MKAGENDLVNPNPEAQTGDVASVMNTKDFSERGRVALI